MGNTDRTITDFLQKEYKDYSLYVIANRACPSLIDGFKTGARKIMNAAFRGSLKNGDTKKVINLAGETMNYSLYQHGDTSLNGTIITVSQDFNFNLNPLYIDGQNGSLRSQDAASPRYLYVRLSKYAGIWKEDYDLLNFLIEEEQEVEPQYYLPIIPVVLAQRQDGMAPGYKFSSMSYNPLDLIDACEEVLKSHKKEDILSSFVIHPYIRGIKKENWGFEEGHWVNYGRFTYNAKKKEIVITDLPYDMSFDSFDKMLNRFVENGDIRDWKNLSAGNDIEYHIDCKKGKFGDSLGKRSNDKKIEAKFKLKKVVNPDLLWVIDENGKLRNFETPQDLIEYFTKFRLTLYAERKKRLVKILSEKLSKNNDLVKFIELICKGKLRIRNRSKKEIKKDMDSYSLPMELISTPMSRCTQEERDALLKENERMKKELEYIQKTPEKKMYLNDLEKLKKMLKDDF